MDLVKDELRENVTLRSGDVNLLSGIVGDLVLEWLIPVANGRDGGAGRIGLVLPEVFEFEERRRGFIADRPLGVGRHVLFAQSLDVVPLADEGVRQRSGQRARTDRKLLYPLLRRERPYPLKHLLSGAGQVVVRSGRFHAAILSPYTLPMIAPAALSASLVLHINAQRKGIVTAAFGNSSTTFCECIRFLHKSEPPNPNQEDPNWHIATESVDAWLESLSGVGRALLAYEPSGDPRLSDRLSSGLVGGGGHWFVCLDRGTFECWEGWWRIGNQKAEDRRIWQVHYARVVESLAMESEQLADITAPLASVASALMGSLERTRAFALRHSLDGFAACFERAMACLNPTLSAPEPFHKDLAPLGSLSDEAARLFAACQHGWVFGGMGSWNDLGVRGEDKAEYEAVSDELFNQINRAFCVACNASSPSR